MGRFDIVESFDMCVPLGTNINCNYKIEDGELHLNGDIVVYTGWLKTGDCVEKMGDWFLYNGRKSAGCKIIPLCICRRCSWNNKTSKC